MTPYFSIVIPTLNEELFLPKLLIDLKKQSFDNFEVIIVDSHSEDKTKEEALKFKEILPLTFIDHEKRNVSVQRNHGVKMAKGKYLVFLDADSRINPLFLAKLEKTIIKKKALFYVPSLKTDSTDPDIQVAVEVLNMSFQVFQSLNRPIAIGAAMIVERNFFNLIGGFDERLWKGEDIEIARRTLDWNVKIKFLPEVFVTYSIRRIKREGKFQAYYKFFLTTVDYILHGNTKKALFEYEMGGHLYKNIQKQPNNNYLKELVNKAKTAFNKLLEE